MTYKKLKRKKSLERHNGGAANVRHGELKMTTKPDAIETIKDTDVTPTLIPSPVEPHVRRLFYFGTYGLMVDPIEMETDKADWLDKKLKEHIKEHLVVGWAISRMKILADMLEDRGQPYFATEIRKIKDELVKQSA